MSTPTPSNEPIQFKHVLPYVTPNKFQTHKCFNATSDQQMQKLFPGFQGLSSKLAGDWLAAIPANASFQYLEVGCLHGASLLTFWKIYGTHPNTTYTCIDPYVDHSEYSQFLNEQTINYETFGQNLRIFAFPIGKLTFYRDFSVRILPKLKDLFYNFIYLDGNTTNSAQVLEDCVLAWRKLQHGGIMIVNQLIPSSAAQKGVESFVASYQQYFVQHFAYNEQYFLKKL